MAILTRALSPTGLAWPTTTLRRGSRCSVNSTLTDVGLTALFSRTLAESGIKLKLIAGLAHDHLFVDWDQAPGPWPCCANCEYHRGRVLG